jgi:hypothetical protein
MYKGRRRRRRRRGGGRGGEGGREGGGGGRKEEEVSLGVIMTNTEIKFHILLFTLSSSSDSQSLSLNLLQSLYCPLSSVLALSSNKGMVFFSSFHS